MNILEPNTRGGKERSLDDIDLIIIPGMAFDKKGNRIGYGGGYYDRLLENITPSLPIVAPAYAFQVVPSIPSEGHDIKVNLVVTEDRVIRCS